MKGLHIAYAQYALIRTNGINPRRPRWGATAQKFLFRTAPEPFGLEIGEMKLKMNDAPINSNIMNFDLFSGRVRALAYDVNK